MNTLFAVKIWKEKYLQEEKYIILFIEYRNFEGFALLNKSNWVLCSTWVQTCESYFLVATEASDQQQVNTNTLSLLLLLQHCHYYTLSNIRKWTVLSIISLVICTLLVFLHCSGTVCCHQQSLMEQELGAQSRPTTRKIYKMIFWI